MDKSAIKRRARLAVAVAVGALVLQACGGGGSDGGAVTPPGAGASSPSGGGLISPPGGGASSPDGAGVTPPPGAGTTPLPGGGTPVGGGSGNGGGAAAGASAAFAQQCSPDNSEAPADKRTASLTTEKSWVRAYMNEAYLWRDEVTNVDPADPLYSGGDVGTALSNYFNALLTTATTGSGKLKDEFSFMMSTAEWNASANANQTLGYGIAWDIASPTPPRNIRVAYVEPGSPAAAAGVRRGDRLVTIDGVSSDDATSAGVAQLNALLYPGSSASHSMVLTSNGGLTRSVTVSATTITQQSVLTSRVITGSDGAKVGYMVFNDHSAPSEAAAIQAFTTFKAQGVTELVLDLRYNGGGYLFIASEIAYMIAGKSRTNGKVFEQLQYNSRRSDETAASSTPFYDESCGITSDNKCGSVSPLPSLDLSRVYVLTQSGTCSASEAIMNGLMGIDVEVIQIGGTTCGKPYGFTAKDNCGYSYFPIEFQGVNAKAFGNYADGFSPNGSGPAGVRGCAVADDLSKELGDSTEGMLAAALQHRISGTCPAASFSGAGLAHALSLSGNAASLKPKQVAARSNRFLSPAR